MKKFLAVLGVLCFLSPVTGARAADDADAQALSGDDLYEASQDVRQKHEQMLYPTVLVRGGDSSTGSGTVIFSDQYEGEWVSLILTNWHVVRGSINVAKEWDSQRQEKVEKEVRRPVHVDLWDYNNYSEAIGTIGRRALIVAWDKDLDLALLQIQDKERPLPYVAALYPEDEDDGPWIFQQVFAVGAGLGKPPFPTEGLLAGFGRDKNGKGLWMATAPIVFGNSGGALFVSSPRDTFELIGVPSMISAYGWGNIVTHMAWSRPIPEIRSFLRNNSYGFVLGDEPVEDEEEDSIN
tara:strand:- start:13869 stop:14750 length:882 start_codon:yes stop_codon:yes gene_type:complete